MFNSKPRLCVFPNDPIRAYFEKGEIKERYFNPGNFFGEVHIISTFDSDIKENKVRKIGGDAKLVIHTVGKINLKNYKKEKERIIQLVSSIKPDVIRAYNPLIQGWLAAQCSCELNVPLVVSLHINYDKDLRSWGSGRILRSLKLRYTGKKIEPFVLNTAKKVICVHNSVANYAKKNGAKNVQVIYNRVNLNQFSPNLEKALNFKKPVIIYVARLSKRKNQECIIRAIKNLDVILLLIGDGPDYEWLVKLAEDLGCSNKVKFVKSVPNSKIQNYYASADIFAAPVKDRGIGIPFLEAMATGLPAIIRKIPDEEEELEEAAYMVENNPQVFSTAIQEILRNSKLRNELHEKSLQMAKRLNGDEMEKRELRVYQTLLADHG